MFGTGCSRQNVELTLIARSLPQPRMMYTPRGGRKIAATMLQMLRGAGEGGASKHAGLLRGDDARGGWQEARGARGAAGRALRTAQRQRCHASRALPRGGRAAGGLAAVVAGQRGGACCGKTGAPRVSARRGPPQAPRAA